MATQSEIRALVDELTKKLIDEGKLIEAGWTSYDKLVLSSDAPQIQRDECRIAFFAGAQHLLGSIMGMLDPGTEPTQKDLERMTQIDSELRAFLAVFEAKHGIATVYRKFGFWPIDRLK